MSVGVVGAGEIVTRVHLPVLSACENVRLAYVADTNPEAAKLAARSFGCSPITVAADLQQLPQSDAVLLAIPVNARMAYYELFAGRGVPVLAEKPLAASLEDALRICALYPDHALGCGFQRRSYATARLARTMVAENWFGPLRSLRVAEGALTTKTGTDARFYDAGGSGGVLMDLGCHSLDLAPYISGAAEVTVVDQQFIFDGETDREVRAHMLLRSASGKCELDYFVTWLRPADNTIELHFDNCVATLSVRPAAYIEIRGVGENRRAARVIADNGATTVYQAFYLEWMSFLDGVRNERASEFSARSTLATIGAVDALYESARQPR